MWWNPFRDDDLHRKVDALAKILLNIQQGVQSMTAAMQALMDEVASMKTVVDSVVALIDGLIDQLKNANTDEEIQAVITELEAQKQTLAAKVPVNTPAE
jgi:hypothetical protein